MNVVEPSQKSGAGFDSRQRFRNYSHPLTEFFILYEYDYSTTYENYRDSLLNTFVKRNQAFPVISSWVRLRYERSLRNFTTGNLLVLQTTSGSVFKIKSSRMLLTLEIKYLPTVISTALLIEN